MTKRGDTPRAQQGRGTKDPGRRDFLLKAGSLAAAGALLPAASLAQGAAAPNSAAARDAGGGQAAPFKLGVASGDPLPDSVVIWTRLVADPLAPGGGMPDRPVTVDWEVAADETFRRPGSGTNSGAPARARRPPHGRRGRTAAAPRASRCAAAAGRPRRPRPPNRR